MKKFIPFIAICLFCCNIYAQVTEAYPTSQRYLFNPYNRDSVYIDSARHYLNIFTLGDNITNGYSSDYLQGTFSPCNEYQMYPLADNSIIQVYGVAIPLDFSMPIPRGCKHFGYYWEEDNLGPHDDSIRKIYWQTFVDSMHVLWPSVTYDFIVSVVC